MTPHRTPRAAVALAVAALAVASVAGATDPTPGKAPAPSPWEAGSGAKLLLRPPPAAAPLPSSSLPEIDTSQLPGATVVLRKGVKAGPSGPEHLGLSLYAACARAPGIALPAHIDDLAFDKMNDKIEAEFKRHGRVDQFNHETAIEKGHLSVQPFSGEAGPPNPRPGFRVYLQGKHLLGFLGDPAEVLLCSVACIETSTEGSRQCGAIIESSSLEATLIAPPRAGFVSRFAAAAVRRPLSALGFAFGLLLALVGFAIALWPVRRQAPA